MPIPIAALALVVQITAVRTAVAPRIDGRGDDAAWQAAPVASDFRTFAPREGATPAFATEARVLYDDRALYVLVHARDPRPDSIVRRLARRDTDGPPNDQIQLFIDAYHDRRGGYEYIVNAAGVKSDYVLFDDAGFDQSWDGVWDVATAIDSTGWTAEYAIPLQQLRFADRAHPTFGFMIWRLVGRTGERASLPAYRRGSAGLVSQFGTLGGLRDLSRPAGLEVTPYALARSRNLPDRIESRPSLGTDVRWLPAPNVTVDATLNPDFGQVEADPAVLDLSGVEIYQAERRPFFLEGAGLLAFPLSSDGSSPLFYSRRIGRRPALGTELGAVDAPTETTIAGATKITARLAPATSLVALSAFTQRERSGERVIEPAAHSGVARLQHDFRSGRSGVGVMLTSVDRSTTDSIVAARLPSSARAVAIATQHQSPDGAYQASAWVAASDVRGTADAIARLQRSTVHLFQRPDDGVAYDPTRRSLGGLAAFASAAKVAGVTRWSASYRAIEPGFDVNELGFLTKSGLQSASLSAGLAQVQAGRVAGLRVRSADLSLGIGGDWGTNGLAYGRGLALTANVQLPNLAWVRTSLVQQLPGAYCSTSCTRGGPALVDPTHTSAMFDLSGDPRRRLVPHANVAWDRDDEGRSHGFATQADVTWHARTNLDASLATYTFDGTYDAYYYGRFGDALSDTAHVTVAHLSWPTRSLTSRVDYALTRTLTLQWYAQAYVSRGTYGKVRELADPRAASYDARFRPYRDSAITRAPGGFDFKQFRSNAVMRWEYRPGSALFVVWSQGRDVSGAAPLFAQRPANVIAVKLSYWATR